MRPGSLGTSCVQKFEHAAELVPSTVADHQMWQTVFQDELTDVHDADAKLTLRGSRARGLPRQSRLTARLLRFHRASRRWSLTTLGGASCERCSFSSRTP